MIFLNVTSKDSDRLTIRLDAINTFLLHDRALTLYQIWKMCEERYPINTLEEVIADLTCSGLITESGWTKCSWTSQLVKVFTFNDQSLSTKGRPDNPQKRNSSGLPLPLIPDRKGI